MIGTFLRDRGVISESQLLAILEHSRKSGMRFGEAGLDLGILTTDALVEVFGPHHQVDFFHLEPAFFPESTRAIFEPAFLLRHGVLPLGYKDESSLFRKKRLLNMGFVHPTESAVREVEEQALARLGDGIQGIRTFLILGEQFIETIGKSYGIPANEIRAHVAKSGLDETVSLYIED